MFGGGLDGEVVGGDADSGGWYLVEALPSEIR